MIHPQTMRPPGSPRVPGLRRVLSALASEASGIILFLVVMQALIYPFLQRPFTTAEFEAAFLATAGWAVAESGWRRYRTWSGKRRPLAPASKGRS